MPAEGEKVPGPSRTVTAADALAWLRERPSLPGCSLITSLPDTSELPHLSLDEWKRWFVDTAELVLSRCPPEGVACFYQTDIKVYGTWVDKGFLVQKAADRGGIPLLWHKVACRRPAGSITFGRPAYAHLLCFAPRVRDDVARSTPDVLPELGEMTWSKAIGGLACRVMCRYVLDHTTTRTIVDPFCGRGTILAVANGLGLDAVGVELSQKRAKHARGLRWSEEQGFHRPGTPDPRAG